MLNGVSRGLYSGEWWGMPELFGPSYQRFRDWRNQDTFTKMLKRLCVKLNAKARSIWLDPELALRSTSWFASMNL
jgi:hypothetical protein